MGHNISGIVADIDVLCHFGSISSLHSPAVLTDGLAFLPLSDDHLDALYPVSGAFDKAMLYLSDALKAELTRLSSSGPVAYVETGYFGGQGEQGATVYAEGKCIFGPITSEGSPISEAMRLLGVTVCLGYNDEFESVGLCRHSDNEDWIEDAV